MRTEEESAPFSDHTWHSSFCRGRKGVKMIVHAIVKTVQISRNKVNLQGNEGRGFKTFPFRMYVCTDGGDTCIHA